MAVAAVFKLTPNSDGSWTENSLHMFTSGADGNQPMASLIFDAVGNLYTHWRQLYPASPYGCGVVFKLKPELTRELDRECAIHFYSVPKSGTEPRLRRPDLRPGRKSLRGSDGGRRYLCETAPRTLGTVFKLAPNSDGSWTESVLHSFTGGGTEAVRGRA